MYAIKVNKEQLRQLKAIEYKSLFNTDNRIEADENSMLLYMSEDMIRLNKQEIYNITGDCKISLAGDNESEELAQMNFCDVFGIDEGREKSFDEIFLKLR